MAKIAVYNLKGEETEKLEISDAVFGLPANDTLVHQVYVALMSNIRRVYAHTKTKAEVAGSGKKPWKQKGTGRARVGTVRNPVWRKGGIVFGPRSDRNFLQKINKRMRRKAIMVAMSGKVREGKLVVLESFSFPEKKTKVIADTFQALKLNGKSIVMGFTPDETDWKRVSRNIPRVENILTGNVNVADVLNHQYVVVSKASLKNLEAQWLSLQETK